VHGQIYNSGFSSNDFTHSALDLERLRSRLRRRLPITLMATSGKHEHAERSKASPSSILSSPKETMFQLCPTTSTGRSGLFNSPFKAPCTAHTVGQNASGVQALEDCGGCRRSSRGGPGRVLIGYPASPEPHLVGELCSPLARAEEQALHHGHASLLLHITISSNL
jgi:hypothetical protein